MGAGDRCEGCGRELGTDEIALCNRCLDEIFNEIDPTGEITGRAAENLEYYCLHSYSYSPYSHTKARFMWDEDEP